MRRVTLHPLAEPAAPGWPGPRQLRVATRQRLHIGDYVRSISWVAALEEAQRERLLARVGRLVAEAMPEVPVEAVIWLSVRA